MRTRVPPTRRHTPPAEEHGETLRQPPPRTGASVAICALGFAWIGVCAPASAAAPASDSSAVFDGGYSPPDPGSGLILRPEGAAKARALALFYRGVLRRSEGDVGGALEDFREILAIDPANLDLAARTAADLAKFGDGDEALAVLEEALARNPDDPRAHILLSDHCFTFDDGSGKLLERGLKQALEAVERFPSEVLTHSHLIAYYLTDGDREKAGETLQRALDQESDDPGYWLVLGQLAQGVWPFRFGEPETRAANLERVAAIYERALACPSGDNRNRYAVAEFYRDVRDFGRAAELFREVYENEPDNLDARESYARMLVGLERHDEAIAAFESLVAINPFDARVRTIVADYHWARYSDQLQEYEQFLGEFPDFKVREMAAGRKPDDGTGRRAAEHYLEAIRLGQPTLRNFLLASLILTETGQLELAASTLQRARFIHPDSPEFPRELARVYRQLERLPEALDAYREAEEIASRAESVEEKEAFLDERFYFSYGATAEQNEDYALAADLLRKSIAETPEETPESAAITYNYLGYMWLEQGVNIDEAGELIRYALDTEPDNSSYVDSIGWYFFRKGDYARALEELLRAEQLMARDYDIAFAAALGHGVAAEADRDPNAGVDAEVLDHIAQTYAALDDRAKAVDYLERATLQESATDEMRARLDQYRRETAAPPEAGSTPAPLD